MNKFDAHPNDRQERVEGFSTARLQAATVLSIGSGGLAGPIGCGLVRKGIGTLVLCDEDLTEMSNLNRQAFMYEDLHHPKAFALAQNLARQGVMGSVCIGHNVAFTEETADSLSDGVDVVVCAVDNDLTRCLASRFFRPRKIPVVHLGVDEDGTHGYVFVDLASGPCLACVMPNLAEDDAEPHRCMIAGAVIDILFALGGIALRAIDSLLMERTRYWDYRSIHLSDPSADLGVWARSNPQCRLCGSGSSTSNN